MSFTKDISEYRDNKNFIMFTSLTEVLNIYHSLILLVNEW